MTINTSTIYSEKNLLEFHKYMIKSKKAFWIFMTVCSLIVLSCFALSAFLRALSFKICLCLFLIILIDLLYIFLYVIFPRITLKKQKMLNSSLEYSFDSECFTVVSKNDYATENATIKYTMLSKVARNKNFVYLFISPIQAYVVDTSELSNEDINNLKNILRPYFKPKKFKW